VREFMLHENSLLVKRRQGLKKKVTYTLSVENNSLAVRKDANGTWWHIVVRTSETYGCWYFGVVVGDESST